jgi:hypothetical protein
MSLVFAFLIELVTIICAGGILFAGGMRTTGSTSDDSHSAITVFACGTFIAILLAASHWLGW